MSQYKPDVVIIGAGISGLAAAWHQLKKGRNILILEASDKAGGYMQTKRVGHYQLEMAPNTLLADERTMALIKELGLENEVVLPAEVSKHRYIYRDGKIQELPEKPLGLLFGKYFSLATKGKLIRSFFAFRRKAAENETIAQSIQNQFGQEVVDYALAPFLTGIYASGPEELLTALTFPQIVEAMAQSGSIIKGLQKKSKGTARRQSLNFKEGLGQLANALEAKVHDYISYNSIVKSLTKVDVTYSIHLERDGRQFSITSPEVIIALPYKAAGKVLSHLMPKTSETLSKVPAKTMYGVHTVWHRKTTKYRFNGFGCLHVPIEKKYSAGAIWVSATFPHCAPMEEIMLCSFVIAKGEDAERPEADVTRKVIAEMKQVYGFSADPVFVHYNNWPSALPVFGLEMLAAWKALETELPEGLRISGNWYKGVSINDCLHKIA